MQEWGSRLEHKIDVIAEKIGSIDVTLAKQHVSLAEHIKRTAILEKEIKPIQKHVAMVNGALKLIGIVAILAEIIYHISHMGVK